MSNATVPQINAEYKKLAIQYHPDKHDPTEREIWTNQFQTLTTIYRTLTDTGERTKYNRQSRLANRNVERDRGRAAEPSMSRARGRERGRERGRARAGEAEPSIADLPPPYRARDHPATYAVMRRHLATIVLLRQEGKAHPQDLDNLLILLDVYDNLNPRPDGTQERENWDTLDPMAPLGQPVAKRFGQSDYVSYIV